MSSPFASGGDDVSTAERFLSGLDVRVCAFTSCELSEDWRMEFAPMDVPSIHFVLSGAGRIGTARGGFAIVQDSLVVIPDGLAYWVESGSGRQVTRVTFTPPTASAVLPVLRAGEGAPSMTLACGSASATHAGMLDLFRTLPGPLARRLEEADLMRAQFARLLPELARPRLGTRAMVEALLKQCLLLLLRDATPTDTLGMPWSPGVAHPSLWRAFVAMMEEPGDAHSLETLAAVAGMSRSAFAQHFVAAFGRSPMALLRDIRLRRAAILLLGTELPVEAVARRIGFAGRSQFSRAFRDFHGKDPSGFRARLVD